jgi:hypothetical protein
MSVEKAKSFLDEWVADNVHNAVSPQGQVDAMHLAKRCLKSAKDQGLNQADLEAAAGEDLVSCIKDAQVAAADAKMSDLLD